MNEEYEDELSKNIDKWIFFIQYYKFYPDLFYDLISPKKSKMRLDMDQRVFIRALARYTSVYACFPRGYGKTLIEVMGIFHSCIFHPGLQVALSAQTKNNAASILHEKYDEILRWFPLMKNEIVEKETHFGQQEATIVFKNDSKCNVLANQQTSKGQRRHRLMIEESALLNNALFKDVLEPIPNVPRRTVGQLAQRNKWENNEQIHFLTTTGFAGSDEYIRCCDMLDNMINNEGKCVLGASWRLPCYFNRGDTKSQILAKKNDPTSSYISFLRNYEEEWAGNIDGALININSLLDCQTYPLAELQPNEDDKYEYYLGVDVARSNNNSRNRTTLVVVRVERNEDNSIKEATITNIIVPKNGENFNTQALLIKRMNYIYNFNCVVFDSNGLGVGLKDTLMQEQYDTIKNKHYGAWDTINTEDEPIGEVDKGAPILYAMVSTGIQTEILVAFIDMVESNRLRLLISEKFLDIPKKIKKQDDILDIRAAHINTDILIDETSNLKKVDGQNGKFTVKQVSMKTDKDIFSALSYILYYLKTYEDKKVDKKNELETLLSYTYTF